MMEFYYICRDCKHINITCKPDSPPDNCEECGNTDLVRGIEIVKTIWEVRKSDTANRGKKKGLFKN